MSNKNISPIRIIETSRTDKNFCVRSALLCSILGRRRKTMSVSHEKRFESIRNASDMASICSLSWYTTRFTEELSIKLRVC
jgi:hypothetical protein